MLYYLASFAHSNLLLQTVYDVRNHRKATNQKNGKNSSSEIPSKSLT